MQLRTTRAVRPLALFGTLLTLLFSACQKNQDLPAPASKPASADAVGVTGTKTVCYVEVNNNNFNNIAKYSLSTGQPLFDIGIIFAANINYNTATQKATLFLIRRLPTYSPTAPRTSSPCKLAERRCCCPSWATTREPG